MPSMRKARFSQVQQKPIFCARQHRLVHKAPAVSLRTNIMTMAVRTSGYAGGRSADSAADVFQRLTDTLKTWHSRIVSRRELFDMDRHLLSDIGLSAAEAEAEANKPFWRA